jgi:predicted dehydrogenase
VTRADPIGVAVVGVGAMGRHHAHNYLALPSARLVAVVDPDPVARAAAEAAFDCPSYASVAAMLEMHRVDAASVVAPTSLHHDLTMELLDAGVHVLVEKPAATRVEDATALAARSRETGLVLQVGHITRFFRAVRLLDERVRAPYLVEARRLTPHARIQDVGVILDLMIHDIDIVLGLVPAPIEQMAIAGHVVGDNGHEDVAAAQITFADGCLARFLASRVAPDAERSLVVAERDRSYRVDFLRDPHTEIAVYQSRHGEAGDTHVRSDRQLVQEDNPLRAQLAHFLARIADGAPPIGTLEDDLRSLRVATELTARLRPARAPRPLAAPRVH